MLFMTAWIFAYVVFAFYTAVLTSWMTSVEPSKNIEVRRFNTHTQ